MIKWRHELKYVCHESEMIALEKSLQHLMSMDDHVDIEGQYVISSVYFDTVYRKCYYENENGIDPRHKYRIRVYDHSDECISIEKKIKNRSMTAKDHCLIDTMLCEKMLVGENLFSEFGKSRILDDWILERNGRILEPAILVEYVRTPYVYKNGNVRITFDRFISASGNIRGLFNQGISKISVLPTGYHVLEVKYDEFLPDTIYNILDMGHMQQTTFSKFYLGCKALEGNLYNGI